MSSAKQLRGSLLILVAAALWATIGLFYRELADQYGLTKGVIVAYRAGIAAFALLIALLFVQPRLLRVARRDWLYFALFGSVGVAAFFLFYVQATTTGPLAIAAVLLYTAPIWITLWGVLRQGETLSARKCAALLLAFSGCALVANIFDRANLEVNGWALVWGALSGLGYAAYSLWSAEGVQRGYGVWTITVYSLGIGTIVLVLMQPLHELIKPFALSGAWPYLLGVSLGPSLIAQTCFTLGLRDIRTSNASILATVEPVIAALLGWLVAVPPEPLNGWQIAGGVCVLAAVIILIRPATQSKPMTTEAQRTQSVGEL